VGQKKSSSSNELVENKVGRLVILLRTVITNKYPNVSTLTAGEMAKTIVHQRLNLKVKSPVETLS
jgi:hypothetical protein